jgi:hypothetical protein
VCWGEGWTWVWLASQLQACWHTPSVRDSAAAVPLSRAPSTQGPVGHVGKGCRQDSGPDADEEEQ